jgi:hypothetical protein
MNHVQPAKSPMSGLRAHGTYLADVLPGLILVPLGGGLVLVGSTVAGVDGATGEDAGIATAMNNASMQIGSAIGLAALVSLGVSHAVVVQRAGVDPRTAAAHGRRARLRPELRRRGLRDRRRRAARLPRDHPPDPRQASQASQARDRARGPAGAPRRTSSEMIVSGLPLEDTDVAVAG